MDKQEEEEDDGDVRQPLKVNTDNVPCHPFSRVTSSIHSPLFNLVDCGGDYWIIIIIIIMAISGL